MALPSLDLIVFGSIFFEIVFGDFDRLPGPGEEIFTDTFAYSCGGVLTPAVAASRAGARSGLATLLGDDLATGLAMEHCRREGVDLSASQRVQGPVAGISVVLNFDGDRAFISHMPPKPKGLAPEPERWLDILRRVRPAWCYLHPRPEFPGLLEAARALGTRVALDVNVGEIDDFGPDVLRCARLADLFLPNEDELLHLTRAANLDDAIAIAGSWCPWLIVKRGPKGAIAVDRGHATEVTGGLQDVVVKDRTGAGDAFAGALIGNIVRGSSLLDAVAAGNAAGSEAVARLGAAGDLPVTGLLAGLTGPEDGGPATEGPGKAAVRRPETRKEPEL
jgi:sugar/nucleoside kinase (ribokinase family)